MNVTLGQSENEQATARLPFDTRRGRRCIFNLGQVGRGDVISGGHRKARGGEDKQQQRKKPWPGKPHGEIL
jgi:hypothetical protein